MIRNTITSWMAAGALLAAMPAFAASEGHVGQGQAVITVLPAHGDQAAAAISQQNLTVKVNGKESNVTGVTPLRGERANLELVVLIDGAARGSLGTQLSEISSFIRSLPEGARAGVAYMQNGQAVFMGQLSADHDKVAKQVRMPWGTIGASASPYFCLSDLAKHWPSQDRSARREVVMITDGIDPYEVRYDPEDPYVQAAMTDAAKAGVVVYSIYWQDRGRLSHTFYGSMDGQNLLNIVTEATGGYSYWQGMGNPVSFEPYFKDINRRLQNQYEINFEARLDGKPQVQSLKLKVNGADVKVDAPEQVLVAPAPLGGE